MRELILKSILDLIKPRSLITLGCFAVFFYCIVTKLIKPDALIGILNILVGFWFGEKYAKMIQKNKNKEISSEK